MARNRQNNNNNSPYGTAPPINQPSWLDRTVGKITTIGGAVLILFSVGGGAYQVGRTFKENEKNLEVFDLKLKHEKDKDSLKSIIKELKSEIKALKTSKAK